MNRRALSLGVVPLTFLAGILLMTACGGGKSAEEKLGEKAMEGMLEQATGQKVDIDRNAGGDRVHIKTEQGEVEMAETSEWPSDMFPEVPRFAGGRVAHVTKGDESGFARFNVFFKQVEEGALASYSDALQAAGWETQTVNMGPKGGLISGQKGDLGLNFTVGGDQGEAVLAVFRTGGGN